MTEVDHTIAARDVLSGAVYTTTPAVKAMAQDYLDLVEAAEALLNTVKNLQTELEETHISDYMDC